MNVVLACNNFPPEFQGGTERVALALARALRARGDRVAVISGSERPHDGRDVIREDGLGVPVLRVPRLPAEVYGLELERPRVLAVLQGVLEAQRCEVLHLHHWANLSIRTLRMARARNIATVATLHDVWTTCPRFFRRPPDAIVCPERDGREPCGRCVALSLDQPLWKLRLGVANRDREVRAELAAASVLTAPSRACAAAIAAHAPWSGAIEVVPHGLLEPIERVAAREAQYAAPLRIGTFGNLVRAKGVVTLVEAAAGVPGVELHLFGAFLEDGLEAEVRALAARASLQLLCHGAYAADGPHPARQLDLAVFPSLCVESYGLVVEEALARGVPVVVSDLGALPERIGNGGVVTPAGDVAALRSALQSVAGDRARLRALQSGIPTRFTTIDDAARRYRELYHAALEVPA